MLTIFQFFATKTDASVLRMLAGSPDNYLVGPIAKHIEKLLLIMLSFSVSFFRVSDELSHSSRYFLFMKVHLHQNVITAILARTGR